MIQLSCCESNSSLFRNLFGDIIER